jgi:hypothetical protein
MPPPTQTVDHGTHHELVEGSTENPRDVFPIDQLVIIDKDKGEHYIRLHPAMTAAQLRAKIAALSITPSARSFLHGNDDAWPHYVKLIQEVFPGFTVQSAGKREGGVTRVQGKMIFVFHADYWRAIAKIGFHYYLANTRRGLRGDEAELAAIREFIIKGGDRAKFFSEPNAKFLMPFRELPNGQAVLPRNWNHVLAADETFDGAVAMVSLFMGPEHLAQSYHINLCRFRSRLIVPGARWIHSYVYHTEQTDGRSAGRVVTGTLTQLR